jgi:protein-serine/threonine kinase
MKRCRIARDSTPVEYTLCEENFGALLEPQQPRNGLITPPPEGGLRPSKIRRHGSKIMSVLRSLTNSGTYINPTKAAFHNYGNLNKLITICEASNPSHEEASPPPSLSSGVTRKVSLPFLRTPMPPTVVHRSQLKALPSLMSIDKGMSVVEILPDISPSTSAETSVNSGKSSGPETHNNSTGKTSQDSKFSQLAKKVSGHSQHSSENKKTAVKQLPGYGSVETPLKPIQEVEVIEVVPEPVPSKLPSY